VPTFPGTPRFLKGAIVGIDLPDPLASVIVFQYNPETLTRTLEAPAWVARARVEATTASWDSPPVSARKAYGKETTPLT
jgi:hypothetical protein